jgi:hypothetical protein
MLTRVLRTVTGSLCTIAAISLVVAGCEPQSRLGSNEGHETSKLASGAPSPTGRFSLTIYSAANPATFDPQELLENQFSGRYSNGYSNVVATPGFGVVREVRPMQLAASVSRLEFTDVAAGIDPTTVAFQSLTAPGTTSVLEQNFDYDLASADRILEKYTGQDVEMTLASTSRYSAKKSGDFDTSIVRGKLLSATGGSYVIRTNEPPNQLILVTMSDVVAVRLADSNIGLVVKPTLNWKVEAAQAGEHQVQVTYQTDGLTWRADYSLLIAPDDKTADLSAWVTLLNGSGISYPDASLKLVAGDVQRFVSPTRRERIQVTNSLFSGGGNGSTGFAEKSFFEYHLYTLGRTTSLNNNSTKQIELFPPKLQVPVEKLYVYNGLTPSEREYLYSGQDSFGDDFGKGGNKKVDIYVRLLNSEANHLGIPLPAGRLRSYKVDAADGNREFTGEDVIQHTSKDEPILAHLGAAFELPVERKQTDFKDAGNTATESFEITLHNHKDVPVTVTIRELLYRHLNWEILKASDKWSKQDYRTIHIPVEVPANDEKKVTYTVKYSW